MNNFPKADRRLSLLLKLSEAFRNRKSSWINYDTLYIDGVPVRDNSAQYQAAGAGLNVPSLNVNGLVDKNLQIQTLSTFLQNMKLLFCLKHGQMNIQL